MKTAIASLIAIIALAGAASGQARQPQRVMPVPQGPERGLAPAEINPIETTQCEPTGVIYMTHGGLAFGCRAVFDLQVVTLLLAFDGGTRPGGISAGMSLLTHFDANAFEGQNIIVRHRAPDQAHQDICLMARGNPPNAGPCRELVSFQG
jgi:hypothetical protein